MIPGKKLLRKIFLSGAYLFPEISTFRLPRVIIAEATNTCMLKCPICPTAHAMRRKTGNMGMPTFRRLVDQIDWKIDKMDFGYSGEPLMNPQIFEMISYAGKKAIPTGFDTNGMLIERFVEDIISSKLRSITVSLDGVSNESLTKYRVGSDFNKIASGLRKLCRRKQDLGLNFPVVTAQMVVMRQNEGEISDFVKLAGEAGVDRVYLKSLNLNMGSWLSEKEIEGLAARYLPANERYRRYNIRGGKRLFKRGFLAPCIFPLNDLVVFWNGDVGLCCLDFSGRHIVGNISQQSVKDMWRSKLYNRYRKIIFRRGLEICKECDFTEDLNEFVALNKNSHGTKLSNGMAKCTSDS